MPATAGAGRILLGVSGGIAAYKAAELLRLLTERGHDVRVIPTHDALRFVAQATWAALSGKPVTTSVWSEVHEVPHVRLGREADLVVVAPATADLLAQLANGRADDLLSAVMLTARCPVLFAPAMHTEMWEHPATVANVATLRSRGAIVVDPAVGRLTGEDSGQGRLPEPQHLAELSELMLSEGAGALTRNLVGRRVLITAGGTREYLDPVRYLGNRSSGRQGFALAQVAAQRGADVTLICANTDLPTPPAVRVLRVVSAEDLHKAVHSETSTSDVVVMAAAVADFRPATYSEVKIRREDSEPEPVVLTRNPDVLAELVDRRYPGQIIVGFAAEISDSAENMLANGRAKLARKGCDLLVVNPVGRNLGFESIDNTAVIIDADGNETEVPRRSKVALAARIWDLVTARLS